jgi:inorganic pyrophosphatase/exopolyphosphatase
MPIINCKKIELPIKTEVTYWLKKHNIELDNLICRDEIDLIKNVENLILVDHHVSPYHEKVISVIDHRPYDENSMLDEECAMMIDEVGSCATLVADTIKSDLGRSIDREILELLYGPIVLDTINFSKEAKKVKELDIEMAAMIESILGIENSNETRKKNFDVLVEARADVSSLDSLQILSKDLKIISSPSKSVRVAIPGVHVFEYPEMASSEENLKILTW